MLSHEMKVTFFTHHIIMRCYQDIKLAGSLDPLLNLWKHKNIIYLLENNTCFQKEFLVLTYQTVSSFLLSTVRVDESDRSRDIMSKLTNFYYALEELPLEEILNAIETLAEEVPYLCEKYELYTEITWEDWFRKYWWAPPLIFGTIFLRLWVQHVMWKRMKVYDEVISPQVVHQPEHHHPIPLRAQSIQHVQSEHRFQHTHHSKS